MLPPAMGQYSERKKVYTPLTMVASLFMQQSPSPRLLPTIGHILEQTIMIAKKRGLLLTDGKQQAAGEMTALLARNTEKTAAVPKTGFVI
jgi:hypothetical protein